MDWLVIPEEYLNYLRNTEKHIPLSDYGKDKYKPFFGALFEVGDLVYVTQISHPQPRHQTMKNNLDFKKVYHPTDNRLIAVINLNYMFPIPKSLYKILQYKDIELYRTFSNSVEKSKYIDLLKTELSVIASMNLGVAARKIYENKYSNPSSFLAQRCLDYKMLEQMAKDYLKD